MEKNAYFQIVHKPKRTMIKVIPSSEGGEMFSIDEVQQYLDAVNITSYDLKGLDTYLKQGEFAKEYPLLTTETLPEDEKCFITVNDGCSFLSGLIRGKTNTERRYFRRPSSGRCYLWDTGRRNQSVFKRKEVLYRLLSCQSQTSETRIGCGN